MATLGKASDCTLYIAPGVYNAAAGETFPIEPGIVKLQGQGSAPTDVIIEAPDGSNIGCYQGTGVPVPNGVDYYVSVDGDDGDTAETAFATFAPFASLTMNPGDKIHVAAGVYTTGATFAGSGSGVKPIEIDFAPGAVYTVTDAPAFALNGAKDVFVSGLTVAGGRGIEVNNGSNFTFTNCVF